MVIMGEPRMGKSSLAYLLILEDLHDKTAVFVFDPHTLVEKIQVVCALMGITPYVIDPAAGMAPRLDPFEVPKGMTPSQVIEILLMSLRSIWEPKRAWGESTAQILRNTFRVCMELGLTFFDAYRFLQDPALRAALVAQLPSASDAKRFWAGHIRRMSPTQVEYAINAPLDKLDAFFAIDAIRPMFNQRGSTMHFGQIMDAGGVCVLALRNNDLATATELLGAIALAKMHMEVLQRVHTGNTSRVHWYLDEAYQYWNTSVVLTGMAEAAKFGLGVRLFSQNLHQYPPDDRVEMLELAGTLVCFRVKRETAKLMAPHMWMYDGQKLKYGQQDIWSFFKVWDKQERYSIQQEEQLSQNELMHQQVRECMVYTKNTLFAAEVPEFSYPALVEGQVVWHHAVIPEPLLLDMPPVFDVGDGTRLLPPGDEADWR